MEYSTLLVYNVLAKKVKDASAHATKAYWGAAV